jgi:hypothetical protein
MVKGKSNGHPPEIVLTFNFHLFPFGCPALGPVVSSCVLSIGLRGVATSPGLV